MFRNFFKLAIRNIIRHKTYSFLNILGLTIGLCCFILIVLYIHDETSYDRFHKNAKKIFRVVSIYDDGKGVGEKASSCPFPVGPTLEFEYPDYIKSAVRFFNFQKPINLIESNGWKFNESGFFFVDSNVFDVFDIEFIEGNAQTALNASRDVIITESTAKKYFENESALGKVLKFDNKINLQISGIIKDPPPQSHFDYKFLASMSTVRDLYKKKLPYTWVWNPCWTYVLLDNQQSKETLESLFPDFIQKYFYDAQKAHVSMYLQPLVDIHLDSHLDYEIEPNSSRMNIYILAAIGIFILIIASINFMNLSTAFSTTRAKEIGIKKVIGLNKNHLIIQFLSEAVILTLIALIFALALVELVLPDFNNFTDKQIVLSDHFRIASIIPLIIMGVFVGLFSGIYPAFYMSRFQPVQILKSKFIKPRRGAFGRKMLVMTQFVISISIIIGTMVGYAQLRYLKNADLGFNKDEILLLHTSGTPVSFVFNDFKNEILKNPDIYNVTASDDILGIAHNTHEFWHEGIEKGKWQFYPAMIVRDDFIETYDIEIVAGRSYQKENKTDPLTGMLINEAMVKHLGWTVDDAIGKEFSSFYGKEKVIGVIKNFNVQSLHKPLGPFVLNMKERPSEIQLYTRFVGLKINMDHSKEVLKYLDQTWTKYAPHHPFVYSFLSDDLNNLYNDEDKLTKLAWLFALITILIACLGLYGLSSFMAAQRTKEIGIRKALGASVNDIVQMITKEFLFLSLSATFIAWIIANIGLNYWLKEFSKSIPINFPFKINASIQVLLPNGYMINMLFVSGLIAIFIAVSVTGIKAYIAAKANPIETLRYE